LRLRDLREALAALELGVELSFGQAEVVGRSPEIAEEAEVPEPALGPAEEREVVGVDALLERVTFGLRDPARGDRSVDAIAERLLQSVAELRGRDAELFRGVVQDRLVLLGRR